MPQNFTRGIITIKLEKSVRTPGIKPNGVELASGKVAELVKSFEHITEILEGFRYKMGAYPLNSTPFGIKPAAFWHNRSA